jgi:crossover junction endodeoxyribonuclease RuvC
MSDTHSTPSERIILGIDPGSQVMGYGIICSRGREVKVLAVGVVELHKYDDLLVRMKRIFDRTLMLIDQYHPDELSIEAPFYAKNVQSMLKLGRAQGTAIAAALSRDIPVFEYAPRKIKQSITGQGNASKEQVALMLQKILQVDAFTEKLDATDGLAAALCHLYQYRPDNGLPSSRSWKDFISKNPGRTRQ